MAIILKTPMDIQRELAARFKARRLEMNLTQEGLSRRSGVSWSSLKRFEHRGLIALDAFLRLALVLECLHEFEDICVHDHARVLALKTLDEILAEPSPRRKSRIR